MRIEWRRLRSLAGSRENTWGRNFESTRDWKEIKEIAIQHLVRQEVEYTQNQSHIHLEKYTGSKYLIKGVVTIICIPNSKIFPETL